MRTRARPGRLALTVGIVLAFVLSLLSTTASRAAAGESLSVNLASTRGPSTGVGEGFLYGFSEDGSRPADQFLQPLGINAFRGGGWFSGGWIKDGYQYGSATRADVDSIVAQAKRLTRPPYHAQYQVLVSDIYGANGGQPSNTRYPCDNGDCSNWVGFIDSTVGALRASGLTFSYDIWNEPDISAFWTRGVNSAQYFQMWDTAYREIRRTAPGAQIVGPSFAFTPERNPAEWRTAGVTAWYLARFAQSGYTNAMRGNWVCCVTPNLTGVLTQSGGSWQPTGNWWALRDYADMTGTVHRIPDQAPLSAPQTVYDQNMGTSGGSITVPFTFQGEHDAFSVYLTPASSGGGAVYATRPWASYGEGPTKMGGGSFSGPVAGKPQDVRFTRSRDNKGLYATALGWQGGTMTIATLNSNQINLSSLTGATLLDNTAGSSIDLDLGNGYYRIMNRTNGMAADSWGDSDNGAPARQEAWNGGDNQQWQLGSLGGNRYQIVNRGTGTALDGSGSTTVGSTTVMWTPNSSTNNEWTITGA
ncbi:MULTISPECIES: RICIN domain-containing protein [Streptomyces violaceusniger group]|uniref:RICIN domain-containing protein n=2 Tax=Streptomyces violaceusniger group TaxID=2839105 RepID=A0ABP3ZXG8_9ACTN|nr:RICIN domain-containing protein [Streptomyces cangkringensis]